MLTEKEQKRLRKYERDLAMPAWKYVLVNGLTFGVMLFIAMTLSEYIFDRSTVHWDYRLVISFFVTIVVSGFLYGWVMRKFMMWDYKKLKSRAE